MISGGEEVLWAEQYKLGRTVIGRVCKGKNDNYTVTSVNCVTIEREVLLGNEASPSDPSNPKSQGIAKPPFVNTISTKDVTTPKQLREMMELDYSELKHNRKIPGTEQVASIEDKRFIEILKEGIHKNSSGNWEAPLPFRTDDFKLPNNKQQCLRRLLSLII